MSGVELSGVEMSTFGMKIGHFNPCLYNRIYCVIPGVEMSPTQTNTCNSIMWKKERDALYYSSKNSGVKSRTPDLMSG